MKVIYVFLLLGISHVLFSADLPKDHPSVKDVLDANGVESEKTQAQLPNVGIVMDTIHSGHYTYIELNKDGTNIWLAAPKVELSKYTKIRYGRGIPLVNFYSNRLKREFPEVYFVEGVQVIE